MWLININIIETRTDFWSIKNTRLKYLDWHKGTDKDCLQEDDPNHNLWIINLMEGLIYLEENERSYIEAQMLILCNLQIIVHIWVFSI